MALSGRFDADFQSFYTAVDKANAKLTDFQSGAGRVETSLNRMVDSFSGRRLVQEVTLSEKAVSDLGGVSRLTERELQTLAARATEAVAKMRAMGVDVPPGIQRLAGELKPVREEMGFIGDQAQDLGAKLLAAFAIERVVEYALEVGKAQQDLQRLGKETQIDVEELQTLSAATREYGLDNEVLGRALFNVSKAIAGGDESVARGLHLAGLSLDEVKDKHGKELFLEIERGLATLTGSLRDTAAADIFGAKLGSALAGFSKGADEAVEKAGKMNTILSRDSVRALAEYADAIERTKANASTFVAQIEGPLAQGLNTVTKAAEGGASKWQIFKAVLTDWRIESVTGIRSGTALATLLDHQAQAATAAATATARSTVEHKKATEEVSKETAARRFLQQLMLDAGVKLEPYQVRALERLRDMGQLNQQNAAAIGVSVDQFKQYVETVRQAEVAQKTLTAATIETQAQISKLNSELKDELTKRTGTQTEIELAEIQKREDAELLSIQKRADAERAALVAAHADSQENLDKITAEASDATAKVKNSFDRLRDGVGTDWTEIRTISQSNLDDIRDRALKTLIEAQGTIGVTRAEIDKLTQKYRDAAVAATAMGKAAEDAHDRAAEAAKRHKEELEAIKKKEEEIAAQKRAEGGEIEYDLTTRAGVEQFRASNPGRNLPYSDQQIIEFAKGGGTLAQLLSGGITTNGAGAGGGTGGTTPLPANPTLGAPTSGRTLSTAGTGVSINAPIQVSGVFDPASAATLQRMVAAAISRGISASRR
jgi:hypothetical protein